MLQGVIPAVRKMKDFETAVTSSKEWIILLETRLGQLKSLVQFAKQHNKKVLLHIDLIQGLKTDEYGLEFLVNEVRPDGIITTRGSIIELVKKKKLLAIQRVFLLDSLSLESNMRLGHHIQPDYIEVLPGKIPKVISEIKKQTDIPIIAGGLITTTKDTEAAMEAGAIAVSTSATDLWK